MNTPIVIGVTGHRDLRQQDIKALREKVYTELKKLKTDYPHSNFVLLDSIASGADTLCAEEALKLGFRLICPLPMDIEEYRKDFFGEDLTAFEDLLGKAEEIFTVPHIEPEKDGRDYLYRQASIYVAAHSHVLLALWDGLEPNPDGCGTAEATEFMLRGNYDGAGSPFRTENDGAVLHIRTPRESGNDSFPISVCLLENKTGSLGNVLKMTDMFNSDASVVGERNDMLISEKDFGNADATVKKLHAVYRTADALSLHYQKKYMNALRSFSIFGMLLVLLFLFYSVFECNLFLVGYGFLMAIYAAAYFLIGRDNSHIKYLRYRALSETIRVQFYLCAAGLDDDIGDFFTWTQKYESVWIRKAVSALMIGRTPQRIVSDETVKELWINSQLTYHQKALKRDAHKHRINSGIARGLLAFSIVFFVLVLILELFAGSSMDAAIFFDDFTLRSLLHMILGGIPAITAFLTNYYGKLSLERKRADHEKMVALYSAAKYRFEHGDRDVVTVFRELAREELIECGNWFSYCLENPPAFNI